MPKLKNATPPQPEVNTVPVPASKQALIKDLLAHEQGASLDEMIVVTGWLPHTTRAALTGLRKKGFALDKSKVVGVTRYRHVASV